MRPLFALGLLLTFAALPASAKVLITHGETVHEYGRPGVKPIDFKDGGGPLRIGFKYDHAGIFWLDAWTWNGDYVLYNDLTVLQVLDRATAADMLNVDEREIAPPFWYRVPPLPTGLIVIGVPIFVWRTWRKRYRRAIADALRDDGAYRKALAIARGDETLTDDDERFDAAVESLTHDGIDERTARRNLKVLLECSKLPD